MKIISMQDAREILGDNTSCKGRVFAKKHGIKMLETNAKHGLGEAVFFDESEVIAVAEMNKKPVLAKLTIEDCFELEKQTIFATAQLGRAVIDLYVLLGEKVPEHIECIFKNVKATTNKVEYREEI